jgi:hypothetical protein
VATPNNKQNKTLNDLLCWSICPDLGGNKWILHYITYNLNDSGIDQVDSLVVVFVDNSSKLYQLYTIDINGNQKRSNFDAR